MVSLAIRIEPAWALDLVLIANATDEYYRTVTTLFVYNSTGYEVVALGAIFLFGWLLERRHGAVGDAAGLLRRRRRAACSWPSRATTWSSPPAATAPRSPCWPPGRCATCSAAGAAIEDDSDLLGALAIAAVLILLPLATEEASALAGLGGGLIGVILGAVLARLPER